MRELIFAFSISLFPMLLAAQSCSNGSSGGYPCGNVSLSSVMSLAELGGSRGNDLWGWSDSQTGKEYAVVGLSNGTAFVDVSSSSSPRLIGHLPTASTTSSWRDVKVYGDHAFIVSEARDHGMQVFDLTRLRGVTGDTTFTADTTLTDLGNGDFLSNSHNIVMDFDRGIAYSVGSNLAGGGLVAIDVSSPKEPKFMGYFSADGYTHDAQIIEKGGRYYALACNENSVTVVNTSDPTSMFEEDRVGISGSRYIHQGWATPDLNYFLVNDELDEARNEHRTRTYVIDISDIENIVYVDFYEATDSVIDHNLYTMGDYVFQANYQAGLQIYRVDDLSTASMTKVGFFDSYLPSSLPGFAGSWSVYPYFGIDKILVSNIGEGLFILNYNGNELAALPVSITSFVTEEKNGDAHLLWTTESEYENQYWEIERSTDGEHFTVIGELPGQGTSSTRSDYMFIDKEAEPGTNFYRLHQVDVDGESSHSQIKSVRIDPLFSEASVFPTVLRGQGGELNWRQPTAGGTLSIFSMSGKLVFQDELSNQHGKVELSNLAGGHYIVKLNTPGISLSQKIVVLP